MRDLDKNPYSLEERIRLRFEIDDPDVEHETEVGQIITEAERRFHAVDADHAARIAALEAEDTANPIAATAVARQPFTLTLDEDAFRQATS